MTTGSPLRHVVRFALPLLAGNLFQQLYNTVDSVVVGNAVSKQALAAVGSTTPIINMIIGIFLGLSQGAMVVISQSFGARDEARVHRSVENTMLLVFALAPVFTLLGIALVPAMLRLMDTPADVFSDAQQYLRIYFGGTAALMVYNMGSGILRAVGDSRRPLLFLVFSSLVNIVLDLVFVLVLDMGVAGVAWATVTAEVLAAVLVMVVLCRSRESFRFVWRDLRFDKPILSNILRVGLPSSAQMAVTSFSNVFVQSYVNAFGSSSMAAWSCYIKLDAFIMLPMTSLGTAATTFVGQNIGGGDRARARRGTWASLGIAWAVTLVLTVPYVLFAPQLTSLFNRDAEVVRYGTLFLRVQTPFCFLCCVNQVLSGALRGEGRATGPMIIMLASFVVFRQVYLFAVSRIWGTILPVALAYPAGWVLCSAVMFVYWAAVTRRADRAVALR